MRFVLIFLFIFSLIIAYLDTRVLTPLRGSPFLFWMGLSIGLIIFGSIFWWVFVYVRSQSLTVSPLERFLEKITHLSMGFLSQVLFVTWVRDGVFLFAHFYDFHSPFLKGPQSSLWVVVISLVLMLISMIQAFRLPKIKRIFIPDHRIHHLRIVQLCDLHVGPWIGRKRVEKIAEQIRSLGPIDLLVLTGDIGDGNAEYHQEDLEPLRSLSARVGKFTVTGNHEGYWDEKLWRKNIEDLGFRLLDNEGVNLSTPAGPISIYGMSDQHPNPAATFAHFDSSVFSLFLVHQPKHYKAGLHAGVSLQLSGHTHAGQFIPWSLVIRLFHKYAKGLHHIQKTWLYVHSGTGFWGPPFRLGTQSEIALIEVDAKNAL